MQEMSETQVQQESQTFTFDGAEYKLNEITDNAKSCIIHIQKIDATIAEKTFELDEAKMTRMAYISVLKNELAQTQAD